MLTHTVNDGFFQGACEALVALALALRVALTELHQEIKKDETFFVSRLEFWVYVDDISIAIALEKTPKAMPILQAYPYHPAENDYNYMSFCFRINLNRNIRN